MIENIRSVVSVNDTCVYFRTSGTTADEVHVCNGRAFAILPVYEPYQPGKPRVRKPNEMREVDICFADVECSALRIDDASNADALLAKADEALVAGGFPTAQTRRERRRLAGGDATCVHCAKLQAQNVPSEEEKVLDNYFAESAGLMMEEQRGTVAAVAAVADELLRTRAPPSPSPSPPPPPPPPPDELICSICMPVIYENDCPDGWEHQRYYIDWEAMEECTKTMIDACRSGGGPDEVCSIGLPMLSELVATSGSLEFSPDFFGCVPALPCRPVYPSAPPPFTIHHKCTAPCMAVTKCGCTLLSQA